MNAVIALYRGKSLFPSRLIEWFSWSKYSHASLAIEALDGLTIYEAWASGGVRKTRAWHDGHTRGTRIDLYEFIDPMSDIEICAIRSAAESDLGRPYDFKGILSFLLRRRMQSKNALFCSEAVTLWCLSAGRILQDTEPWKIMPGHIGMSPILRYVSSVIA